MTRIAPTDPAYLDAQQQTIYDNILKTYKRMPPPIAVWLHRSAMCDPLEKLGHYVRYSTCLPARLSEFVILLMAKHWHAQYAWVVHKPIALSGGLAPEIIEAVRIGEKPNFTQPDEALIYEFVTTLNQTREMPEEIYERAIVMLGRDGVLDLTGIIGFYALIAIGLKVFDFSLLPGQEPDLPPR